MTHVRPIDLSIVFISYDEPDATLNFEDLLKVVPHARRVHGVKGFDAAHVHAGNLADTPFVITIDGDNRILDESFFETPIELIGEDHTSVISFSARIRHNGLAYGNGGLKIWPRLLLQNLRTHERALGIAFPGDFVWRIPYAAAQGIPTESIVTASPAQAYRAGFREGYRLAMTRGVPPQVAYPCNDPATAFSQHVAPANLERLRTWCAVGRDQMNGDWAMLGAREGLLAIGQGAMTHEDIADFVRFDRHWSEDVMPRVERLGIEDALSKARRGLVEHLGLRIPELDPLASEFVKSVSHPSRRPGRIMPV